MGSRQSSQKQDPPEASAQPAPEAPPQAPAPETGREAEASASKDSPDRGAASKSEEPAEPESRASSKAQVVSFNVAELEAEIESLRADPPPYVSRIGRLKIPSLICDDDDQLVKPKEGEGPWDLTLSVAGGVLEEEEPEPPKLDPQEEAPEEKEEEEGAEGAEGEEEAERVEKMKARAEALREHEQAVQLWRQRKEAAEAYNFHYQVGIRFDSSWPIQPPTVRFQCIIHHALLDDSGSMLLPFYRTLPRDQRSQVFTLRLLVKALHDFLIDPLKCWGIPAKSTPQRLLGAIRANQEMNQKRLDTIVKYADKAVHKELFSEPLAWREEWFEPGFWKAQQENTEEAWRSILREELAGEAWRSILREELAGEVFSFKMLTDEFCEKLLEEIFSFYASGLPARRPNSMNNYGIILNEIGLEPFIDHLQGILQPLGEMLWPGAGSVWDGHHCFIVRYREGEDLGLDMHTDDSDVTFNICLGLDFAGAGLQFCGVMGAANHRKRSYTYQHEKGRCVCHLGRKRHGADDISRGERLNLILWNHSSTYRQSEEYKNPPYSVEEGPPDEVCVSYTHDRDYGIYKEYPPGKEHFKGRGWCPPRPYEYADFKPDAKEVLGG